MAIRAGTTISSNTPMRFRKLRIAWSVVWGVAWVLLIVLWVRSYWWRDFVASPFGRRNYSVTSLKGSIRFVTFEINNLGAPGGEQGVIRESLPLTNPQIAAIARKRPLTLPGEKMGFGARTAAGSLSLLMPYWFLVLVTGTFTGLPWASTILRLKRFSLRTLLIAMTLVAILLGLIVCFNG